MNTTQPKAQRRSYVREPHTFYEYLTSYAMKYRMPSTIANTPYVPQPPSLDILANECFRYLNEDEKKHIRNIITSPQLKTKTYWRQWNDLHTMVYHRRHHHDSDDDTPSSSS